MKKIPLRMCICCRQMKPKTEMLRIVKTEDGIVLDKTGRKNGRGAYICYDEACLKKLKKAKMLNKVFSCAVDDGVYDAIIEEFNSGEQN